MTTKPQTLKFDAPAAVAEAAAERLLSRVDEVDVAAICLTGGSTPKLLYELLASPRWRARLPWERIHWFIGDERAVLENDSMSNGGMARRTFLEACAPPSNVHLIAVKIGNLDETARTYEAELRRFQMRYNGRPALFDLVLLGVGPDGHIASLFPDSAALHETQRWVVGVDRANVAPFVPRISLTLPCLGNTREMLFLVTGESKCDILARVFGGEDLPANQVRAVAGETVWLVDDAAYPTKP